MDYDEKEWISRETLLLDVPDLVRKFENFRNSKHSRS